MWGIHVSGRNERLLQQRKPQRTRPCLRIYVFSKGRISHKKGNRILTVPFYFKGENRNWSGRLKQQSQFLFLS